MTAASIPERRTGRRVWAVAVGFFSVAILSLARDQVLHAA